MFTVTETGGQSGARIDELTFVFGGDETQVVGAGDRCFLTDASRRVPAGGTWSSSQVYFYCMDLDIYPWTPVSANLLLQVNYVGDSGTRGVVSANAPLPPR